LPYLIPGAPPTVQCHYGDVGSWKLGTPVTAVGLNDGNSLKAGEFCEIMDTDAGAFVTSVDQDLPLGVHDNGRVYTIGEMTSVTRSGSLGNQSVNTYGPLYKAATASEIAHWASPNKHVFCIPIYSGIIGVLMPEKKFLPLSLLPLELELTVNPFAMYAAGQCTNRRFTISKCEIFSHTLFFE